MKAPRQSVRGMIDNSLSARDVIESILPDFSDRLTVLNRLARSSQFASSIAPAASAVTLVHNGFRMNVGQVEALTFFNDTFRILLAATKADSRLASLPITGSAYKSIRGPQCIFVGTIGEYRAAQERIDSLHEDYIRVAATTISGRPRQGTPFAIHHSNDLITYAVKYVSTNAQRRERTPTSSSVANGTIQQHFVAYHNVDEQGTPLHRGLRGSFETNKPKLPQTGDVLWCFEGVGRPKEYRLVKRGVVSRSVKTSHGPSVIHYQYSDPVDVIVNDASWFAKLRKGQGSFSFGVNRIQDPDIVNELERFAADSSQSGIEADIADIERDRSIPDETTRKALIDARRGQGGFRRNLDVYWGHACAVTKCALRDLLRASHIKPWRYSTREERLDPANGLLLSANIDILFDKGHLSFDDDGRMLISSRLSTTERRALGLSGRLRRKPHARQRIYLAQHRKAFGFPD
jgi:hypothetical protein